MSEQNPSNDGAASVVMVKRNGRGIDQRVQGLQRRELEGQAYVRDEDVHKRPNDRVPQSQTEVKLERDHRRSDDRTSIGKRKRDDSPSPPTSPSQTEEPLSTRASSLEKTPPIDRDEHHGHEAATPSLVPNQASTSMMEDEADVQRPHDHKQVATQRNFDKVNFGQWQIKTWYFSPYPLLELEVEEGNTGTSGSATPTPKIPGVNRPTVRSHPRTSDLFMGAAMRSNVTGEKSILWVCERCFKYMAEGSTWELHAKKCDRRHPPGRKVYQRGAHTIWEVDGAKEKLYCQNLSLFGKLFIDVKTLFFDCDNFLFYILTDADSQRDHVLGFFSKEKISYDDYNLACIIVLPPYQRKGYGMLMIEFSYELSRRAGKVGTPERPLSELGLRSYLTYWVATLVRFFRRLLTVLPPEYLQVTTDRWTPDLSQLQSTDESVVRRKRPKGWDGEVPEVPSAGSTPRSIDDPIQTLRRIQTTANADGSATSHVVVQCTLAEIARATNLRVEDAAFALSECGLLLGRVGRGASRAGASRASGEGGDDRGSASGVDGDRVGGIDGDRADTVAGAGVGTSSDGGMGEREMVGITREMVEAVAKERRVKEMCMSLAHVLL